MARASLSSKPSPVEKTEAEGRFVSQRVKYKEQLTSMRKKWTEEIEERNAQIAREEAAEKERVVLAKAIRLREKRKQSVVRQAADKAAKVAAGVRFKEHLANNLRVYSDRKKELNSWHEALASELEKESQYWLSAEDVDAQITEEFFDQPSTTGLLMKDSEHWRYQVETIKLKRFDAKHEEEGDEDLVAAGAAFHNFRDNGTWTEQDYRNAYRKKNQLEGHRAIAQDFLESMIGTGEERAQYRKLLQEMEMRLEYMPEEGDLAKYTDYPHESGAAHDFDQMNYDMANSAHIEKELALDDEPADWSDSDDEEGEWVFHEGKPEDDPDYDPENPFPTERPE